MQDRGVWSIPLYPYAPIAVRLHAFFLFFGVVALYAGVQVGASGEALAMLFCLFASVLLHEIGHCVACYRMGGVPKEIVIGPLGGLSTIGAHRDPVRDAVTAAAGPIVNLSLVAVGTVFLALFGRIQIEAFSPFSPTGVFAVANGFDLVRMFVWVNWMLFLVNALPVAPLDGGRLLLDYLSTRLNQASALQNLGATGMCLGFVLLFFAPLLSWGAVANPTSVPTWLPLCLLAIFVYFSGQQAVRMALSAETWNELNEAKEPESSFEETPDWQLLGSADTADQGPPTFVAWLKSKGELQQESQSTTEIDEDRLADEILGRVSLVGIDGLTEEERQILDRVSKRLRAKQRRG